MPRIIIAGASEKSRAQLSRLLASSGFQVFRACGSGGELRRAMSACEDGIIVLWGLPPDCRPDELALDYHGRARILLIARPETIQTFEGQGIFTLKWPCPPGEIIGALEMLSQLHGMGLPRRGGEDRALVERAKRVLMRDQGLSEPEAHRRMQKYAMKNGIKMTEYAARLLETERGGG